MNYFSMFSGIGGFELGINQAFQCEASVQPERQVDVLQPRGDSPDSDISLWDGRRTCPVCVGYSEIDKYAIATYEHNFKGHTNYGDATTIDSGKLPDFDLLVGGFPCQAFSVAGKRAGFNDTRGTLFFDIARILADKRPGHLVLENVKGLLSHDAGKTFQTILGVLADLGYLVEWQVLNSKDFGVPQNRERIYIVGHLGGKCGREIFPILRTSGEDLKGSGHYHQKDRYYDPAGVSPTLDGGRGGQRQSPKIFVKEATSKGYAEATVGDTINISVPTSKTRRGRVQKGLAGTLQTSENMATLLSDARIRRLTPTECERLQGFPDNWTIGSDTQRYKQCGNAVTVNVVEAVITAMCHEGCLQNQGYIRNATNQKGQV